MFGSGIHPGEREQKHQLYVPLHYLHVHVQLLQLHVPIGHLYNMNAGTPVNYYSSYSGLGLIYM